MRRGEGARVQYDGPKVLVRRSRAHFLLRFLRRRYRCRPAIAPTARQASESRANRSFSSISFRSSASLMWLRHSFNEPRAKSRNRANSVSDRLPNPSAMFAGGDATARRRERCTNHTHQRMLEKSANEFRWIEFLQCPRRSASASTPTIGPSDQTPDPRDLRTGPSHLRPFAPSDR